MSYKTIVVTAATVEPFTMDEARGQLRVKAGDDDDQIRMLRSIARDKAEKFCNRFFTAQQVKIVFQSGFDTLKIDLPYPDLASVDSITYIDTENAVQTVTPGTYTLFSDEQVIYPDVSFPSVAKSYTVTVTTAPPLEYGGAKIGMLMMLTDLYELRTESVIGFSVADNPAAMASIWPYRVQLGV
jgi:hypothetical protein